MNKAADFKKGDRAHFNIGSDVHPCTVVHRTPMTVKVRVDSWERDPDWTPDMVPGGFSAHCRNNHEQKNIIREDPGGHHLRFTLREWKKDPRYQDPEDYPTEWVTAGDTSWHCRLKPGWAAFHDYNS